MSGLLHLPRRFFSSVREFGLAKTLGRSLLRIVGSSLFHPLARVNQTMLFSEDFHGIRESQKAEMHHTSESQSIADVEKSYPITFTHKGRAMRWTASLNKPSRILNSSSSTTRLRMEPPGF